MFNNKKTNWIFESIYFFQFPHKISFLLRRSIELIPQITILSEYYYIYIYIYWLQFCFKLLTKAEYTKCDLRYFIKIILNIKLRDYSNILIYTKLNFR